jgi:hypothetical protein
MLPTLRHRLRLWATRRGHPTSGWVFATQTNNGSPININDLSSRVISTTLKDAGLVRVLRLPSWVWNHDGAGRRDAR